MTPDLDALLDEARARPITGWDVRYDGRITREGPAWSFAALVSAAARASPDLLDMGTCGEWLSQLANRPPRTVATEGWPPNIPVARARRAPPGITVVAVEGAPDNVAQASGLPGGALPFPDGDFHLVGNRHESYLPAEVWRILAPGGCFLTQQVGAPAADELHHLVGLHPPVPTGPGWTLAYATAQLARAGFVIEDAGAGDETMTFADVGALVWYLSRVPGLAPISRSSAVSRVWPSCMRRLPPVRPSAPGCPSSGSGHGSRPKRRRTAFGIGS